MFGVFISTVQSRPGLRCPTVENEIKVSLFFLFSDLIDSERFGFPSRRKSV